jgi:hypothetical protein
MDPKEIIEQSRQQRQQKAVEQARMADAKKGATFASGQDNNTGQPLVRAIGGAAVPMRSLSNVQAEVGQQGRSDGRGFDVGTKRSHQEKKFKPRVVLDTTYLFLDATETTLFIYSNKIGLKSFLSATFFDSETIFAAALYRPSNSASVEDLIVLVQTFSDASSISFSIYQLDILSGVTFRTLRSDISMTFIPNLGLSLRGLEWQAHLYPSFISTLPFQYGALLAGDTLMGTGFTPSMSGVANWRGSWRTDPALDIDLYAFGKSNYLRRAFPYSANGNIAGQNFDLPIGTFTVTGGAIDAFINALCPHIFSERGDLNLIVYPPGANSPFEDKNYIEVYRAIQFNGTITAGKKKRITIPDIVYKPKLLWVDVVPLFNTGRGLNP